MDNYEEGFKKTKDQTKKIWNAVAVVQHDNNCSGKFIDAPRLAGRHSGEG